nr:tRNA (adenosine(37)-N6)-threonylcarbamoyltransferase complex dimerization subunit type 1 TsaB [uncultured Roseococcus sp.]
MRLLVLDAALSRCLAALVVDGALHAEQSREGAHGQAAALPPLAEAVLVGALDAVAVVVGPGSFTGLRSAIALAEGIATARDIPLVAVTTGEALAASLPPGTAAWAVTENRRGELFLERFDADGAALGPAAVVAEPALPQPEGLVYLVGDGATRAAARMAARGWPIALGGAQQVEALAVEAVARRRLAGELPALAVAPVYVEAPATT